MEREPQNRAVNMERGSGGVVPSAPAPAKGGARARQIPEFTERLRAQRVTTTNHEMYRPAQIPREISSRSSTRRTRPLRRRTGGVNPPASSTSSFAAPHAEQVTASRSPHPAQSSFPAPNPSAP